jgi:hypothetical protein
MSSGGFGSGRWGKAPWGRGGPEELNLYESLGVSEDVEVIFLFKLNNAQSIGPHRVKVDFSNNLNPGYPANYSSSNYGILGLNVLRVLPGITPNSVILHTVEQGATLYTITVANLQSSGFATLDPDHNTDIFAGYPISPTFYATAQSRTKVQLDFSSEIAQTAALSNPSNYTLEDLQGNPVSITSVAPFGPSPVKRVVLELGTDLVPGGYYVVRVSTDIQTSGSLNFYPDHDLFQWEEMLTAVNVGPISIGIGEFSGEFSGGILGDPLGQVFFSPSLEAAAPNSIIQVEEVSVCTRAYDVYEFPQLLDPQPLFTFGGPSSIGDNVLWAPADRLGQAQINLTDQQTDSVPSTVDGPCDATLHETWDPSRVGLLNNTGWGLYDGVVTPFIVADNLAPIPAGTTTNINLQP